MSMPRKGSRRIVVDGRSFRWRVRSQPTYCQANAWSPLTVAVEHEPRGAVLVLVFAGARPDNWIGASMSIATPASVAAAIRASLCAGWDVDGLGGQVFFHVATGRLGTDLRDAARDRSEGDSGA